MAMVVVVMMLVLMGVLENYVEIGSLHPVFIGPANLNGIAVQMQAHKGLLQLFRVCAQIQQGGNGHIAADTGITL